MWSGPAHIQPEPQSGASFSHYEDFLYGSSPKDKHVRYLDHCSLLALTSQLIKNRQKIMLKHLCPQVSSLLDPFQFACCQGILTDLYHICVYHFVVQLNIALPRQCCLLLLIEDFSSSQAIRLDKSLRAN